MAEHIGTSYGTARKLLLASGIDLRRHAPEATPFPIPEGIGPEDRLKLEYINGQLTSGRTLDLDLLIERGGEIVRDHERRRGVITPGPAHRKGTPMITSQHTPQRAQTPAQAG